MSTPYSRQAISEEVIVKMQEDRAKGFSVKNIAELYGVSKSTVRRYTISAPEVVNPSDADEQEKPVFKNPITKLEVRQKRREIRLGQIVILRHTVPIPDDDNAVRYRDEPCRLEAKYNHLAVFIRPNGTRTSRTYIELCMADRGQTI